MTETSSANSTVIKSKFATRIGKVLSKSTGATGFSTALMYKPDVPEEQKHGSLYFVIDINSDSPLTADIAYNLIDIVKEEYYRDLLRDPAQSFEAALKSANEEFAAIAKEGEKSWIGKANITIAAISGNQLLAVHRGTGETHLWRNGKMMNLSEGMYTPGETPRPEETLTNIIEGELTVGDKLIISTAELFYYLSVEKLRRIIESHSPASGAQKIANQLGQEDDVHKTNLIIAEFSLPELIDAEAETAPEDNWVGVGREVTPSRESRSTLGSIIGKAAAPKSIIASPETEVHEYQPKATKDTGEMAQELDITEELDEQKEEATAEPSPKSGIKLSMPKINYGEGLKTAGGAFASLSSIAKNPGLKKTGNVVWRYIKYAGLVGLAIIDLVFNFVSDWVDNIRKRPNGDRMLMITVGVLVVIVVGSTLTLARNNSVRVSKKVAVESLDSAIQKRDAARAAIIYQDNNKASTLLYEAYQLAETASKHDSTKAQALPVLAEIKGQLDEVGRVKRIENPKLAADFASLASQIDTTGKTAKVSINALLGIGNDVYTYDTEYNKIYKYNGSRSEVGIVNSLVSNEKKLTLGTVQDNNLIFYANPASVYALDLADNSMKGVGLDSGNWNNAADIISYTDKLYLLDPDNNNIWKYKRLTDGYTRIAPYFEDNSGIDLKGVTDFEIDGDVYTLGNGMVTKYTSGQKIDFNLRDVPGYTGDLNAITDIFASVGTSGLYVLDPANSRVLVFDKEGAYQRQYIFSGIDNPTNIYADEAAKNLWILTGTQVYRLDL
ncbi:hypothetical protein JXA59_01685 [Patescibacteria group bacterium]|nr:hypothetical protein [Patescibacteria group bacterium]